MPTELGAPSRRTLLLLLPPQKENTHRQCCALCKGFQHYGGERCHFVLHRTMVSAAVMTTRTITNPRVKQISSFMFDSLLHFLILHPTIERGFGHLEFVHCFYRRNLSITP